MESVPIRSYDVLLNGSKPSLDRIRSHFFMIALAIKSPFSFAEAPPITRVPATR